MKCPKCSYVRTAADGALEGVCPKCGIAYIKYDPSRERAAPKNPPPPRPAPPPAASEAAAARLEPEASAARLTPCADCGYRISKSAHQCVRCGAPTALQQPGRREVVVTDVDMPINAMAVFMVKWVIATIPAMFALALIGFSVVMVLQALFT